jgi:hypothetical protein
MSEARQEKDTPKTVPEDRESQEKRQQNGMAELRRIREEHLDKTIEDTFPSSDPPSSIPDPGEEDPRAA